MWHFKQNDRSTKADFRNKTRWKPNWWLGELVTYTLAPKFNLAFMEHVETKQATKHKLGHKFSDNPFDKILFVSVNS